jgi:hypothetical protein
MNNASDNCASVALLDDAVVYCERDCEVWRIPVSAIAIVGEYTTSEGPYVDDYFIVLVAWPDNCDCLISFYADGRDTLLEGLGARIGASLKCALCNSATLRSRCIWPSVLANAPLFRFTPTAPVFGHGLPAVLHRFHGRSYRRCYSAEAEAYLAALAMNADPQHDPS